MSNNNKTIIIGLVILLGVGALIAYRMSVGGTEGDEQSQQPVVQQPQTQESTSTPTETTNSPSSEDIYNQYVTTTAPQGSKRYVLSDTSEASYTVQKVFVGKPTAEVIGVTQDVEGAGWYDATGKKFYLKANIGLDTLKSDSEKRDSDILPLFTPATAMIELNGDNSTDVISMTEPFETELTANVTIGSVTKEVTFAVTGMLDETKFNAEGTANILMSDFGIEPPSALNIFTVEDETVLKFKVEGMALEESAAQE